jgi:hypothetical protein
MIIVFCTVSIVSYAQANNADTTELKAEKAERGAISYLNKSSIGKSQNLVMIVEYLQRVYGMQSAVNAKKILKSPPVYDDEKEQMKFFAKLYGGHTAIGKNDIVAQKGLIKLMAWSINTELYKPDKEYSEMLWSYSSVKDRNLTHAALCLAWIKEQGAQKYVRDADSLERYQVAQLLALALEEGYSSDTGLEALAGLIRLGRSSLIRPEWIEKIIAAQLPDGGWPILKQETISNDHTSLLADWILLDYLHHGKVNSIWIAR